MHQNSVGVWLWLWSGGVCGCLGVCVLACLFLCLFDTVTYTTGSDAGSSGSLTSFTVADIISATSTAHTPNSATPRHPPRCFLATWDTVPYTTGSDAGSSGSLTSVTVADVVSATSTTQLDASSTELTSSQRRSARQTQLKRELHHSRRRSIDAPQRQDTRNTKTPLGVFCSAPNGPELNSPRDQRALGRPHAPCLFVCVFTCVSVSISCHREFGLELRGWIFAGGGHLSCALTLSISTQMVTWLVLSMLFLPPGPPDRGEGVWDAPPAAQVK